MKQILIVYLALLSTSLCFGQTKSIPLNISVFSESTAIPFQSFISGPIHPGIQFGTAFSYQNKAHSRLFQTINTSYFYHKHLAQGVGLSTELGYEIRTEFGLAFTGLLGLGYMHTFSTTEEFTFSDGHYEKKPDKGNPRIIPSFALDLGYYINPRDTNSPKFFVRYHSWVEYPYSPGFIPLMAHINLHIGFEFFILKQPEND